MQERQEQHEGEDPIRTRGQHTPATPRHSTGPPSKRKGNPNTQTGDADIRRGVQQHSRPSLTMPPTIRYATPPSTTAPPSTTTRGERTEDTPPHEHHRHTVTHTTPHTWQRAVHDTHCSTRQHCSGMSRAQPIPLHWAAQQHTHRHSTHRGRWTPSTHPLTYSHSFTFTQQMINVDQ